MNSPVVSVIIPCYNEKDFIEKCLISVVNQKFSFGGFEILVIDGISTDGTREIVERLANQYSNIKLIDNEKRFTPYAMNIGIKAAAGKYIAILGAHSEYDPGFLDNSIQIFKDHPEISCAGGPIIHMGKSSFGRAVALAMSNPIGVGNAKHRFPDYEGYAEGACYPIFKREVFDRIGFYDEYFVRNQDDELNYRLAKSGGKVYLSPKVICVYYVRDSVVKLFKQYFQYGYWRMEVIRKHKFPVSFRQVVPSLFFFCILLFLIMGLVLPGHNNFISYIFPLIYVSILFLSGIYAGIKNGFLIGLNLPAAIFILHFAYATGFLKGLINHGRKKDKK